MFKWLTSSKKGFTIVELMIVVVLLSLGAYAMTNLFLVGYRAFEKSEERYRKQEAIKYVAELLNLGSEGVTAAMSADIFDTIDVVPKGSTKDTSWSYLYLEEAYDEDGNLNGYYLSHLKRGQTRNYALQLSDVPMYITIRPYQDPSITGGGIDYQCGIIVELSALEDDFEYVDDNGNANVPTSDDKYYTLEVAYHFPNMIQNDSGIKVNHINSNTLATANTYDASGNVISGGVVEATHCDSLCSYEHCGCSTTSHTCEKCNCICPNKCGIVLRAYCDSILAGDNLNTNAQVPKLCFIATASYGSDSSEVGMLCDFRDKCLLTNELGRKFVNTYYKYSPPVAEYISEHEVAKKTVQIMLKPVVSVAAYALNPELRATGIFLLVMFLGCGAGTVATFVVFRKRKKRLD